MKLYAAAILLAASAAFAQDATPVFRANSELVLLDVQVLHNKTNTALGDLQAGDFEVSEDGVQQTISYFSRDKLPLSVVLLFDLTDSVRGVLHRLASGAQTAPEHLKPEDEVAVMVYAASAEVVDGFTEDRARTAAAIKRAAGMKSGEAAFFNEAVYQAATQLEATANPSARRVILWFTDNIPNVPSGYMVNHFGKSLGGRPPHAEEEAIRKLHESGTVVMPLLLRDPFWIWADLLIASGERSRDYPPGDVHKYAEVSGGYAAGMRGKGVEERLAEAIDNLRERYTIGYRPTDDKPTGTFCRVKVQLAPNAPLHVQEWRVLAREGYYRK